MRQIAGALARRICFYVKEGDTVTVYIHDGIGFNPEKNSADNEYIENYKKGVYVYLEAGSPPGSNGNGYIG